MRVLVLITKVQMLSLVEHSLDEDWKISAIVSWADPNDFVQSKGFNQMRTYLD